MAVPSEDQNLTPNGCEKPSASQTPKPGNQKRQTNQSEVEKAWVSFSEEGKLSGKKTDPPPRDKSREHAAQGPLTNYLSSKTQLTSPTAAGIT